jgi:hypothetical protein
LRLAGAGRRRMRKVPPTLILPFSIERENLRKLN